MRTTPILLLCGLAAGITAIVYWDLPASADWQIITLMFLLAVPASLLGERIAEGWHVNPWTIVYIGCFVATHLLSNTFWLIYYDVIAAPGAEINLQGARYVLARKVYTLHLFVLVVLYLGVHAFSVMSGWRPKHDLQSKLVLTILFIAEAFAALEYVECKIFEPYEVAVAKTLGTIPPEYACQRAITPLAPFAAPVVTSCYLVWVNVSAWKRSKT